MNILQILSMFLFPIQLANYYFNTFTLQIIIECLHSRHCAKHRTWRETQKFNLVEIAGSVSYVNSIVVMLGEYL